MKVLVSSVFASDGLPEAREQLKRSLEVAGFQVLGMETFGARPRPALEVCLSEVRQADAVVTIIGPRYGSLIADYELSYTHREYQEAAQQGIPTFVFVVPPASGIDALELERLARFRSEAGFSSVYMKCKLEQLAQLAVPSIERARSRGELGQPRLFRHSDEYFAPQLESGNGGPALFNHLAAWVGREGELEQLVEFMSSQDVSTPILTIVGPGGIGKSRFMLEAARAAADRPDSPPVYFLEDGFQITVEHLEALPTDLPVCICIDDAHRKPSLTDVVLACKRHNARTRFVISARPSALPGVQAQLGRVQGLAAGTSEIILGRLTRSDAERLAEQLLGDEYRHLAERLVDKANGNPLVVSIGALCIASSRVAPETLDLEVSLFQATVLDRLLEDVSGADSMPEVTPRLLQLLAAVGPINREDEAHRSLLASHLGIQQSEVLHVLASLKQNGLVGQRGRFLRVVPDILADHLLFKAAVVDGRPSGYVDELLAVSPASLFGNIVANAAELDWRTGASDQENAVLTATWASIRRSLSETTTSQRLELLTPMRRVAVFAPLQVLQICEDLLADPKGLPDPAFEKMGIEDKPSFVAEKAIDLVGFIATHPGLTRRCLSSLWASGTSGGSSGLKPRGQKQIVELLKYKKRIHQDVQLQAIEYVIEQLRSEQQRDSLVWAVQALQECLAKSGEHASSDGPTISLGSYSLSGLLPHLSERRLSVIDALSDLACSNRLEEASAAVSALGRCLASPESLFGRVVTEEERDSWIDEAQHAIDGLVSIKESTDDTLYFFARRQLRSVAPYHWPKVYELARKALTDIPPRRSEALFDVLLGRPYSEAFDDYQKEREYSRKAAQHLARTLWESASSPSLLISELLGCIDRLKVLGKHPENIHIVMEALAESSGKELAALSDALCQSAEGARLLSPVLVELRKKQQLDVLLTCLETLAKHPDENKRAMAVSQLYTTGDTDVVLERIVELWKNASRDTSSNVQLAAVRAYWHLPESTKTGLADDLVAIEWAGNEQLADEVCMVLGAGEANDTSLTLLSDAQIERMIAQVEVLPVLDSRQHWIMKWIAMASQRLPDVVVSMLLARVRASDRQSEEPSSDRITPLPYGDRGLELPGVEGSPKQAQILQSVIDGVTKLGPLGRFWMPGLFAACSPNTETGLPVLLAAMNGSSANDCITIASLAKGFDHKTVFENSDVVSSMIELAQQMGANVLRGVSSELWASAISGVHWSSPGQPAPRHVEQERLATQLEEEFRNQGRHATADFFKSIAAFAKREIQRERESFEEEFGES